MITGAFVIIGFVFMACFLGSLIYECWREYQD